MKAYIFRLNGEPIKISELQELCLDEFNIQYLIKYGSVDVDDKSYDFEEIEVKE